MEEFVSYKAVVHVRILYLFECHITGVILDLTSGKTVSDEGQKQRRCIVSFFCSPFYVKESGYPYVV